jgi:glycosyltransferase involved in cell wall biosynthesis
MASIRVLVVTNLWPTEADPGFGCFVEAQMNSLRPLGVEYDVLFIDGRKSRWNYARAVGEMRGRLSRGRYDLIHAHFGLSGWVARCQGRIPVVVTFHGDDVLGKFHRSGRMTLYGRLLRVTSRVLCKTASANIVQSARMHSELGLSAAKIIPCGVDLDLFRPMDRGDARRRLHLELEKIFVLFPFDPALANKRRDLVEAAVARARQVVPQIRILSVYGKPQGVVSVYMNAADLLVLASNSEGSPNVVKEAMATELPVITVDVGDAAEQIGRTEGNYLVARDAEAIATTIIEVCRRGERAHGRASIARLSMEKVARQIVDVYSTVLGR